MSNSARGEKTGIFWPTKRVPQVNRPSAVRGPQPRTATEAWTGGSGRRVRLYGVAHSPVLHWR